MVHVGLREHDEAFRELERAVTERDLTLIHLRDHVYIAALRTDPRFLDLLELVGIPDGPAPLS